jgi:hypothetical protein
VLCTPVFLFLKRPPFWQYFPEYFWVALYAFMYIDARCDYDLIFIGSFASLLFSPAAIEMHKPSTAHVMNTRNKVFKYQKKMRAA